jgi:hypothetical protein
MTWTRFSARTVYGVRSQPVQADADIDTAGE